jgi:pimeloyl-ACP methyl ester carboxylesterase
VRKRCVFYMSGFDPKGASRYHALYRDEALKQSRVSGVPMDVGPRQKTPQGNAFWQVTAQRPEGVVDTHFEFLRWDDIVRTHWPKNQARLLLSVMATWWLNVRTGAAWHMLKLAWPPLAAMLSAFLLLSAVLLGTPLLAAWIFATAAPVAGPWTAVGAAGVACALWVQCGRLLDRKFSLSWLMRSCTFTAQQAQGRVPQMDTRLEQHAATVLQRIEAAQDDEVLLVGHSSGAMLAASVLAKVLLRRPPASGASGPVVSLLTLGHCMPMLGCLPQADAFRGDLQVLADVPGFDWVDFTAPTDGCCFALVNPLAACGVRTAMPDRPKLLSPRFAEMFDAATYRDLGRDKFRIHFQYLMATGKSVPYDYFAITAGSMTLATRFHPFPSVTGYTRFQIFGR